MPAWRRCSASISRKRSRSPETRACITGCSGWVVCSRTRPGRSARPARPATWCSSWKVRSPARRSPPHQAEVGVDHADQGQVGEVMALGDHLGADQEVELAVADLAQQLGRGRRPGQGVAGQQCGPGLGEERGDLLGQALDPRAAGRQGILGLAGRAVLGQRQHVAAVVALQAPDQAVLDQPGGAIGAVQAMAAAAAEGQRRVAPPVQEQQGLLPGRQRLKHALAQGLGQPALPQALDSRRPVVAQVDQARHRAVRRHRGARAAPTPRSDRARR